MINRWTAVLCILLLLGAAFAASQAQPAPEESWLIPLLIFAWAVTAAALIPSPLRRLVRAVMRWLHDHPALYWTALLFYFCGTIVIWLVPYQPTNGRPLSPVEIAYLLIIVALFLLLTSYEMGEPVVRAMGGKLGKSKFTGVLITISTFLFLFTLGEAYLRVFYITTDAYAFTAMTYWWYKNYGWNNLNSLGFRDYEPVTDDAAQPLTRVAVLGDSFVMGHGINDIDDTFPQMLERELGAGYDVNVIAASGWDSDVELYQLESYPLTPDIVVLSYYLNDIDYLLEGTELDPDNNFSFPENPAISGFVRAFFLPNYIYFNLLQFTSQTRSTSFVDSLITAHLDDDLWDRQVPRLYEMVAWANNHNKRLIVLLWPNLGAVEASTPATQRIREFFEGQGVQVVDMTDVLRGKSTAELIVNRFDTHPGIETNRIAAQQLFAAIMDGEQNP